MKSTKLSRKEAMEEIQTIALKYCGTNVYSLIETISYDVANGVLQKENIRNYRKAIAEANAVIKRTDFNTEKFFSDEDECDEEEEDYEEEDDYEEDEEDI